MSTKYDFQAFYQTSKNRQTLIGFVQVMENHFPGLESHTMEN